MSNYRAIIGLAVVLIGTAISLVTPASAQTQADIDNANRRSEQIQRDQELRQEDERQRNLRSRRPPAHIEIAPPPVATGSGEGCRDIARVEITGAENMSERRKREIIGNYAGRCLGVAEIQSLLGDVTKVYIDAGYATTRAYLPQQDLTTGTLRVDVIEGRIKSIQMNEADNNDLYLGNVFPGLEGEVLNLRDIEQGLDQLNRLSSNNATMDIAPGEEVGESMIIVRNDPSKRWHMNFGGDNHGSQTTGRRQGSITGSIDDVFGLNELISLTERRTIPFGKTDKRSRSRNFYVSVPYGYTTWTAGYSWSDYNSTLVTPIGTTLGLEGDNRSQFVTMNYTAYRTQDSKLNLSVNVTKKKARNYIAEQLLTVSSRTLTVADFGVDFSTVIAGGSANFGVTYSKGLNAIGALDDAGDLPQSAPRAQFEKMAFNAGYVKPFKLMAQDLTWSSQLTAQVGFDTLFGSEQISIGGIYSIRGFYGDSLANDHGYFLRNDLTLRKSLGTLAGREVIFRPYIAFDIGAVTGRVDDTPDGTMAGGAAGFNLAAGGLNFEFYGGRPLITPDNMDKEDSSYFGRFSLSF